MAEKINKEALIELVRNEPALWNKREKIYNNRDLKPDLWDKIGKTLNITGKTAQKSWETLRDSYRKIRKRAQSDASGIGTKKDISWPHYNAMCFLDDLLVPRDAYPSLPSFSPKRETQAFFDEKFDANEKDVVVRDDEEDEEEEDENAFCKDVEDGHGEGKASDALEKRMQSRCRTSRSKRRSTFEEEALELEKRKLQILESRQLMSSQKKLCETDDDYLFLMSLLPYLKKLDDIQKMRLRIEMLSSVARELENCKYQESSAWNATAAFAMPPRPPSSVSSYSSRTTPARSRGNTPDRLERQRTCVNSSSTQI